MTVKISVRLLFELAEPTDTMLQFEAAAIPEQHILSAQTAMGRAVHCARVAAQDSIGERLMLRIEGKQAIDYDAVVRVNRKLPDISSLKALRPHELPGEAIQYLLDSRYCLADKFRSFVDSEFEGLRGGAQIAAMRDWIQGHFVYTPGSSNGETTALDTFIERRGVCRDYAHVMVTLARAAGVPARYCSVYAPGVEPPDFHAVAEVFLADPDGPGGTWQLVDATGMADAAETVKIGVGRDAADVSFMTTFGMANLIYKDVQVSTI
ncbi:transglutaminase family protein [Allopontixanthobacter sp.]|uniref:transglutaminase-like domain-containing protein n=1 Tax=Allopontixanthobacter sp. TaxID=2906452 RepID=UPI002ABC4414|nr:transglutaminase family protein [Allopontixanthobacter sp.]MDZ4306405.1 transglutaminase family protein [Allopontixanthobacter sp.]